LPRRWRWHWRLGWGSSRVLLSDASAGVGWDAGARELGT
jgi:hypothetical protein